MKTFFTFLTLILASFTCISQSYSSLSVFVSEKETGKPIPSASIIIKEAGWASKTTGSDGRVFFDKSVPIGEIHYIVSKEGYQGVEGTFNITTEEKSNSLNVKLTKFRDDQLLIIGEVVDANERDIEGAIVEVKVADIIKTTKTDAGGNYKIELILNGTPYDVNTIRIEVKCKNNGGKKSETINLTRKNVIYKDFKIDCDFTDDTTSSPSKEKIYEDDYLKIVYKECKKQGSRLQIKLLVTAKDKDQEIRIYGKNSYTGYSRMFDNSGNEYKPSSIRVANKDGSEVAKIVKGLPTTVVLSFDDLADDADTVSLLELSFAIYSKSGYQVAKFNNLKMK